MRALLSSVNLSRLIQFLHDTVKSLPHDYMMWMGDGRGYNEEEFKFAKEMATSEIQRKASVFQVTNSLLYGDY